MGQGGEKSRLGMAALMWISHAERPLQTTELCHALAVEIGSPKLNDHNVPAIGTLIACCQGLVVVDEEASIVRLIHSTLQEYLRTHPKFLGSAHSTIAEICLSYLNSQQVKALSASSSPDLQDKPFIEYSSQYWGVHAKQGLSDCAKLLALNLLGDYNTHISTQILFKSQGLYMYLAQPDKSTPFTGLHCASLFGIVDVVASLVEMEGCDINQMDYGGNTPLLWAAWGGHEGVVELLLGLDGVNPDKQDKSGRTPLSLAAGNGHGGVVKILLGRDEVSPDKPDNDGQTPLWVAACNGHEGVVSALLGRDGVNPDRPDKYGQTPLFGAAKNGQERVVEILLERDEVNPNKSDALGQTPVRLATEGGFEGVVRVLLEKGADPNKSENPSLTPLPTESSPLLTETGRLIPSFTLTGSPLGDYIPPHAALESLPLFPNHDGFYSVLGPLLNHQTHKDQANGPANNALAYNPINIHAIRTSSWDKVFCVSSKCSGNRFESPFTVP